jgi:hypothetical protein
MNTHEEWAFVMLGAVAWAILGYIIIINLI